MNKTALLVAIFGEKPDYIPPDEVIAEVLSTLTSREEMVIEHRFADTPMTLEEIGKILPQLDGRIGVSRETVRWLEAKALRKLRHPSRSRRLWPPSLDKGS